MQLRDLIVVVEEVRPPRAARARRADALALCRQRCQASIVDRVERMVNGVVRAAESEGEIRNPQRAHRRLTHAGELKSLDDVAYVRFASVYRDFREAAISQRARRTQATTATRRR